jgi:hypothetical protein
MILVQNAETRCPLTCNIPVSKLLPVPYDLIYYFRYGSNLTESGTVEMDAGIMDGTSLLFGAVGAVSGTDKCSYFFPGLIT